ncbi:hypothetical protein NDU88_005730 [Pleurodeles waltl]|uniref:Uncharacterized protein n=1 Tax=Pleurodeles waltl TaxID=8319 RepID=A0AAV7TCS9_PLEWA|nr:hypothetical protein NDU88_005730 [Pleurodeles waltl]
MRQSASTTRADAGRAQPITPRGHTAATYRPKQPPKVPPWKRPPHARNQGTPKPPSATSVIAWQPSQSVRPPKQVRPRPSPLRVTPLRGNQQSGGFPVQGALLMPQRQDKLLNKALSPAEPHKVTPILPAG